MPYQRMRETSETVAGPACIHLRSKAMYTTGDLTHPNRPDEEGSHYCWCKMTQHVLGPDQKDVDPAQCVPGRSCYREVYEV